MTMKIEVYIPEDDIRNGGASDYLARSMAAIGFARGVSLAMPEPRAEGQPHTDGAPHTARGSTDEQAVAQAGYRLGQTAKAVDADVSDVSEKTTDEQTAQRERGKPAPGKARRTKAEIEEDEAADAADAEPKPAISTGEDRVDPDADLQDGTNPEAGGADIVPNQDDAQDAADEAADPANAPATEATRDDVRAAMMAYGGKMGMDKLTVDLLAILADKFPGGKVAKLSDIPEDAAAFQSVIDALNAKMEG